MRNGSQHDQPSSKFTAGARWSKRNWRSGSAGRSRELKPPLGEVLSDFYLHGLRYEEIARKHGLAVGSVGVYLKRGLEAIRRIWGHDGE